MTVIIDGTTGITSPAESVSGNLTFTGTGNRITGDFSNATTAAVSFQTSTTNGVTAVTAIPNGTSQGASFRAFNGVDQANASWGYLGLPGGGGDVRVISGQSGTGTYLPMTFYTGNSERVRIDTSGNVGIGTSSPGAKLDVAVTGPNLVQQLVGTSGVYSRIGTVTSSFYTIHNGTTDTFLYTAEASALRLGTNSTERARIDSSGNLLVGRTSAYSDGTLGAPAFQVSVLNGSRAGIATVATDTTNIAHIGFVNPNGLVGSIQTTGSATSYATSSDYRLKDTIAPMTGALAKVALLKPCTYKWKSDGSDGQGFIAHELDEVVPGCVTGEKDATSLQQVEITPAVPATFDADGNTLTEAVEAVFEEREVPQYQGIDTSFLVATLTAAIQEQQTLITALTARITALEAA